MAVFVSLFLTVAFAMLFTTNFILSKKMETIVFGIACLASFAWHVYQIEPLFDTVT